MNTFDEVKLTWGDSTKVVPGDRVLQLIATIEEVVTLEELTNFSQPKRAKIAKAYAMALVFAGFHVTDDQVYLALFDVAERTRINAAIDGLLRIMIPPESLKKLMPKVEPETGTKKKKTKL